MADKELKDWCKTCNVEPPAMKFKCPECEHNPDKENRFVKDINVPGKEQIIIDGVNIFDTLDNWADLISQEWCSGEYPVAEIIKNYILDINKQLARKTQECEEYLKQRNNILEESKRYLEEIRKLQKSQFCVAYEKDCYKVCEQQNCAIKNSYRYRKALEEIEGVVKEMHSICIEEISITASQLNDRIYRESCERFKQILDIINKAKGENNGINDNSK